MPTLFRSAGIPLGFASLVVYAVYISERQVVHLQSAAEASGPEIAGLLRSAAADICAFVG
ncbi:hypothetical protein DIPPA_06888 [Diplonema papillatum]|nr:hypothetical protein DIPPA_06888 [Diplonema papillatum]